MQKTNIKITIFTLFIIYSGIFSAYSALASAITAENVIDLLNQEREKVGLILLVENESLSRAAREKAQDMKTKDYFAHNSPEGLTPWHWIEKNGYDYKFAGENLAINFQSAEKQNRALMESATHKENILGEQFNEIGVGVVEADDIINGKKSIITVQLFGNRGVAVAALEKKPDSEIIEDPSAERQQKILLASVILPGKNSLSESASSGTGAIGNKLGSYLQKTQRALVDIDYGFYSSAILAALLLAVAAIGTLEVLRRFHFIEFSKDKSKRSLKAIGAEEFDLILGGSKINIRKMQSTNLYQMKQRE